MLTAVTYLYTRRRRNTTVSVAIAVSQEIRRTRRQPAETNFSHPDCGESCRPPARYGCSSGNFIQATQKYGCRKVSRTSLGSSSAIIKLLYSNFIQSVFGERCCNFVLVIPLRYLVNAKRHINRIQRFVDVISKFCISIFVNQIFSRIEHAYSWQ